jgi:hypothetical protein
MSPEKTVRVYVVAGIDPLGHVVELAKFFDGEHAKTHVATHYPGAPTRQAHYRDVGIVIRDELAADQHPAHWGAIGHAP